MRAQISALALVMVALVGIAMAGGWLQKAREDLEIGCNLERNLIYPGESVGLSVTVSNSGKKPYDGYVLAVDEGEPEFDILPNHFQEITVPGESSISLDFTLVHQYGEGYGEIRSKLVIKDTLVEECIQSIFVANQSIQA